MATTPLNSSTEESSWKNTAYDLIKAAIDARDDVRIAQAVQVLNARIIDVQNTCIPLKKNWLRLKEKPRAKKKNCDKLKRSALTSKTTRLTKQCVEAFAIALFCKARSFRGQRGSRKL